MYDKALLFCLGVSSVTCQSAHSIFIPYTVSYSVTNSLNGILRPSCRGHVIPRLNTSLK